MGVTILAVGGSDPPLVPDGEEARDLLRRELLRPDYHDGNVVQRLLDWLVRRLDRLYLGASGSDLWVTVAVLAVLLTLVVAVGLLVSRTRTAARARRRSAAVLTEEAVTAPQLRARAEAALAEGRYGDALLDAFRCLVLRQVERGRIDARPGATAHELGADLGGLHGALAGRLGGAAAAFDAAAYGDRPTTREQALEVLGLDDDLAGVR